MILAAGLWWLYFDAAADVNLRVLELSGGSPTMARAIFAVGHMLPAFSLLLMAAGVGLCSRGAAADRVLAAEPRPRYLPAGHAGVHDGHEAVSGAVRALLLVATFMLGRLHEVLSPHEYVWLLAAWVAMCAALDVP